MDPLTQINAAATGLNQGVSTIRNVWNGISSVFDMIWNVAIIGGIMWLASMFMPESWKNQIGEWLGQGAEMAGNTSIGVGIMPLIGKLFTMFGFEDPIRKAFLDEDPAKFQQRLGGDATLARIFGSREMRSFLYDNGITLSNALSPDKAKLLIGKLNGEQITQLLTSVRNQGTPEQQAATNQSILALLRDREVPALLLNKLNTAQVGQLINSTLSQGTPEQVEANKGLINSMLTRPDILGIINTRHPQLITQIASQLVGAGAGIDFNLLKTLISSPEGLESLRIATPTLNETTLAQASLSRQQLTQIVSDLKADNANGKAYRTLLNNDMLPLIGQIMPRLNNGASLTGALEIIRNPDVRAKLGNSEVVGAVAQLAPQNAYTRLLFTPVREQNGSVRYPNIDSTIALSNFVQSGNPAQQQQRADAVSAIDALRVSGRLPAEGTAERQALQTFLGEPDNRSALRDYLSKTDISSLDTRAQQAQMINLIRGERGDAVLRVLADPVAVKWMEEQTRAPQQTGGSWLSNIPGVSSLTDAISSRMSSDQVAQVIRNTSSAPQIIRDNAEAVAALREINKLAPQQLSSLETPRDMAAQIAEVANAARGAGVANATVAIGSPLPQQFAGILPTGRDSVVGIAG